MLCEEKEKDDKEADDTPPGVVEGVGDTDTAAEDALEEILDEEDDEPRHAGVAPTAQPHVPLLQQTGAPQRHEGAGEGQLPAEDPDEIEEAGSDDAAAEDVLEEILDEDLDEALEEGTDEEEIAATQCAPPPLSWQVQTYSSVAWV